MKISHLKSKARLPRDNELMPMEHTLSASRPVRQAHTRWEATSFQEHKIVNERQLIFFPTLYTTVHGLKILMHVPETNININRFICTFSKQI